MTIQPEQDQNRRVKEAYKEIKEIYRKQGAFYSFYTTYRNLTCPIKRIFELFPEGAHYTDVGCGFGFISIWTALVFPQARVEGMDVEPNRIAYAQNLAKSSGIENLTFSVKDITKEDINPTDTEIILLIDLFHHVPFENQLPFLKQCMEKTPKKGYIVFKDIDTKPWWKFRVNYVQDYLFTREKTYSRHKDEYMQCFRDNGFEPEYFDLKKGYPYSHYLIRARKL